MSGYVNGHNILGTSRYLSFMFIRHLSRRQGAEGLDTWALSLFCLQYMLTWLSHSTGVSSVSFVT